VGPKDPIKALRVTPIWYASGGSLARSLAAKAAAATIRRSYFDAAVKLSKLSICFF